MSVHPTVRAVFGHFQNLNLAVLMDDLRAGRAARQGWASGSLLCPLAHGLPAGRDVRELKALGQSADLSLGCDYAASRLGADHESVLRFVRSWDEEALGAGGLLRQLEVLWEERLADAEAVEEILRGIDRCPTPGPSAVLIRAGHREPIRHGDQDLLSVGLAVPSGPDTDD